MICLVTGSGGLIGSEAVRFFAEKGYLIVGLDNDMRSQFFGPEASTNWNVKKLQEELAHKYLHYPCDIRDKQNLDVVFKHFNKDIKVIIHCAAQPSHDWAAREPITDFDVNAKGTLNVLECMRQYCPEATMVFTSTNKVYGDRPNKEIPLTEYDTRWDVIGYNNWTEGIDETMSIDQSLHSVFGASKVAADVMCQEYGKYFGLNIGIFRGGCLTGPAHSGTQLHGFLAYLMKCAIEGTPYKIFGYKGKQVRDNIHSWDLVNMFWHFVQAPRRGEVYNAGGGRFSNCSMLEAIEKIEKLVGKKIETNYVDQARSGDHIWYVSDVGKFKQHYPGWQFTKDLDMTLGEMYTQMVERYKQ